MSHLDTSIFYDINNTLSKNCIFNFVLGGRNAGKTYGFTKYLTNHFLKTGMQFAYIRRFKDEFADIKNFFKSIQNDEELVSKYGNITYDVKGGKKGAKFYINGKLAGYGIVLTTSLFKKGSDFEGVDYIVFDEFILEDGYIRYMPNEVFTFLNLCETLSRPGIRGYDTRILLYGNEATFNNPYTHAFGLVKPKNKDFIINNDVLVEIVKDRGVADLKKKSRFYQAIPQTFTDYAVDNKSYIDNDNKIKKKSGKCDFMFTIYYEGDIFGVWKEFKNYNYFVSNDHDPKFIRKYAFTCADHTENSVLMKSVRQDIQYKRFIESYKVGKVYFENQSIKMKIEKLLYKVMW